MTNRTIAWFRILPLAGKTITIWALVAGVASIGMSLGAAMDGELYGFTRIGLGLLGIVGSLAILSGARRYATGMYLLLGWSLLQVPFISSTVDGNLTKQVVDGLLGVSQVVTVNGIVTDYSATGLNTVGILVTIVAVAAKRNDQVTRRIATTAQVTP